MTIANDVDNLTPEQIAGMSIEELSALSDQNDAEQSAETGVTDESPNPVDGEGQPDGTESKADEVKPDGVATKDGKSVIPYEVLERTRKEATDAKQRADEFAQQKAEAETKLAELSKKLEAQDFDGVDDSELFDADELDALTDELPEVAGKLKVIQDKLKQATINLQKQQQKEQETQKVSAQQTAQQAIDSVPKLAFIQTANPRLFKMAVEIDAEMRELAKTDQSIASLSMPERFNKVVEKLESELGVEIKLPSSTDGNKKTIEVTQAKINGLGDLPGGASPVVDEFQAKLQRSPTELAADFSRMSAEQLTDFVDRASRLMD